MNKTFHSVWNTSKQAYVAAAETVSAKGKPSSGVQLATAVSALLGGLLSLSAHAQTAPPPLSSTALPTSGQVSAGQASISVSGANMVINQSTNRAAINWQTFNVGKDAHVQFQQPSAASVTLNRVMTSDPSQIFGRISANGQVVLTNPVGVYFSPSARVDVGGIVATTHGMSDADFMAGKNRYERNGSTGSVVNEGEIKAALGGYIALLAPEVRNQGAVIAHMGTVALASGEAIDLKFDSNNRLTSLRVDPSQIAALVDNRHAVQAPGGLVIISAQSMDRLVGGVVRNSGRIEANGLQQQGGRMVLSASHKLENTGSISANATADGPAGKIEISAPNVSNSGSISATGSALHSAGSVLVQATNFTQTATGSIDLSAPSQGGQLSIQTTGSVQLQGSINTAATQDTTTAGAPSQGGQIDVQAQGDIEVNNATLDASGGQGGTIALRAKAPAQPGNPQPLPDAPGQGRLAIMGHSTLSTRGRSDQGGSTTLLGDHINLLDTTHIDATGATGGGTVLVGGDWQGGNGVYQATTLSMAEGSIVDASATQHGNGGKVVLWSTELTDFAGQIASKGAGQGSTGGDAEVSGKAALNYTGFTNLLGGVGGKAGELLLDPNNLYIVSGPGGNVTAGSSDSLLGVDTLTSQLSGASVTISTGTSGWQVGHVGLMTALNSSSTNNLTINASGNVVIAADVNIGGKLTINTGTYYDFVMGTNLSNASGVNITAYGGFEKTSTTGISYLTGSITTNGTAITLNGDIQLANFNGSAIGLNSNGGNIALNNGIISRYYSNAQDYALLTSYRLYHGPSISSLGSDILLTFTSGTGMFLGQQGISSAQYLLVGGGGGGGASGGVSFFSAGGGGGGQVVQGTLYTSLGSAFGVAVGAGGAGSSDRTVAGGIGGTSRLGYNTAQGGGGGASGDANRVSENAKATAGFTGGGGGAHLNWTDLTYIGATGTGGANTKGGDGEHNGSYEQVQRAGGGGGAGGPGGPGSTKAYDLGSARGGAGVSSSLTGSTLTYGGGGGGGKRRANYWYDVIAGAGRDGGADGGANAVGSNAVANRGGGGGGSGSDGTGLKKGGDGGSGLVVVRYTVGNTSATAASALVINAGSGSVSMGSSASDLSSLQISVGSTSTVSGTVSGGTSFNKSGTGTLSMTQNNTYTGTNTISAGTLVLRNDAPNPSNKIFNGTGALSIEPSSASFSTAFSTSGWSFASTLSGLTLGKDGNTQAITVASAIGIAGPISIYGGNIAINAGLTASGANTITLKGGSTSSITGTGFVNAGNLLLLGGGTITLNSVSNAIGTLAASGVGSLTYVDSNALTLGTVGSTNGISATGAVSIATKTGDLTVSKNVATTSTSATAALVINAGLDAAAGTSTGGNIVISGSPTFTTGIGGRATLFSGSITGSTGLTTLSGLTAGTKRFRYKADETTNFGAGTWTNLGTGIYAVYREQPAVSLSSTSLTMTYGDLLPTISATGMVNGDTSTYTITSRVNSTSGNIKASATSYTITTDLVGLGYSAASGSGTLTVNQKALTLTGTTAASRVYDSTTTATVTALGSLTGLVGTDVVTASSTGATFDTKDVGTGKTVTLAGVTLTSTDASNYSIATTATTTANITAKALTVTASNATKIYDGAAYSGGNVVTYSAFAGTENSTVLGGTLAYSGNSQGAVDAAAYAITPGGLTSSNYAIQFKDGVLTVSPKTLTISSLVGNNKVYDATTTATLSNWGSVSTGVTIGSLAETLTLNHGTATFNTKNVGTGKTVTATGYSLADGANGGKASNYVLSSASATTTADITALALNINGVSINDKVYDSTTTATVNGGNITKLGTDVVSLVTSGATGTFASADVARDAGGAVMAQPVTVSGFSLLGADAINYTVTQPTGLTATITPKTVTVNALSTTSKTYDGTTSAPLSSVPTLSGLVSTQTLFVSGSATYASADAGTGIQVSVTGLTLADGNNGGKAGNYALSSTTASTRGDIARKPLTITGLTAADKTYDGTTNVSISNWGDVSTGVKGTDGTADETLTLNTGSAAFASKDVTRDTGGNPVAKTVTASGFSLANGSNGGKASNYLLTSTTANTTATINPAALQAYANDDAKLVTTADPSFTARYAGFVNGETASTITWTTAPTVTRTGADEAAGIYAGALTFAGATDNYTVTATPGKFTIVGADQLLVKVNSLSTVYGDSPNYSISSAQYLSSQSNQVVSIVNGNNSQILSVTGSTVSVDDGAGTTASFGLSASGASLSSAGKTKVGAYQLSETGLNITPALNATPAPNFTALTLVGDLTVTQKALTPSVTAGTTKTYDGTTNMAGLTVSSPAILPNDMVSMTTGSSVFASRNVGSQAYTVNNVALTSGNANNDASNYYISNGTITGTGTINKATLTLTAVADTKVYDGTKASSKTVGVSGLAASDSITGLVQTFDSKNVTATTVASSGYTVNDGNSGGNYDVVSTTATGSITPAVLTLSAVSDTKGYDGTTASNKTVLVSGLVAGDSLGSLSQSYLSKNVMGSNLSTLQVNSGYTIKDTTSVDMSGNYTVTKVDASGTITPASLLVSGITAADKTYNGNTSVASITYLDASNLLGKISGDSVTLGTVTGSFDDKNAGVNKTVTLGYTLSGADLGNYTVTRQDTTTATISKRTLNVTASGVGKVYDGTTGMGSNVSLSSDKLGSDVVNISGIGAFSTAAAGSSLGYTLTVTGITGADAGNYSLAGGGTFSGTDGTITQRALTITANSATKTYDGQTWTGGNGLTFSGVTGVSASGFASGEDASVLGGTLAWSGTAQGTRNAGSYSLSASGFTSSNYALNFIDGSLTVNKAALTLAAVTDTKVYDGNKTSAGAVVVSGLQGTDTVTNTRQEFTNQNALGTGSSTLNVVADTSGYVVNDGNNGGNYNVTLQTANGTITPRTIAVVGVTANSRAYNGSTDATSDVSNWGTVSTGITNEALSLSHGNAHFDNANAGTGKTVTVSAYSLANGTGGLASNYQLASTTATTTTDIGKAAIRISSGNITKTYDGDTSAVGTATVVAGTLYTNASNGNVLDSISGGSFAFANKNVGIGSKTVTVSGVSLNDGNSGNNYDVTYVDNLTSTINKATLTVTASAVTKTYDGTTSATGTATLTGLVSGETANALDTQAFLDKNAGTGKTVRASGVSIQDSTHVDVSNNYAIRYVDDTASTIHKAPLTVTANAVTKTYDGTTNATGLGTVVGTLSGAASGETLASFGRQAFLDKNAGVGKTVRASGVTIKDSANVDVTNNYAINYADNTTSTINKAALTVTANNDAKFISQADTTGYAGAGYSGFMNAETVSVLGGTLSLVRANAGTNTAGFYSGVLQANGLTAANYSISYVPGDYAIVGSNQLLVRVNNLSAIYGTAPQYAMGSVEYFDGTNVVRLDNGSVARSSVSINPTNQVVVNDGANGMASFTLAPVSGVTSSAGKLMVGHWQLGTSGLVTANSQNFSNTVTVVGSHQVTPKAVTALATDVSKMYDGNTSVTNASLSLGGTESGDALTVSGIGNYANKNAGTGLGYTFSGVTLSGTDVGNYYLSGGNSFTGNNGAITPKTVTLSGNKTYDGTTTLSGAQVNISGLVSGETLAYTGATATDAHVATQGKYIHAITLANATDGSGGLAANYQLPMLDEANAAVTISARALTPTISNIGVSKVYDGTTNAHADFVTVYTFNGLASGDTGVGMTYASALYNDANVASANALTLKGLRIDSVVGSNGSLASDYVLDNSTKSVAASITKADLTVRANNDARFLSESDTLGYTGVSFNGFVNGESLGSLIGTASVTRTNAGTNTAGIHNNVLKASGLTAANYKLNYVNGDYTIVGSNQLLVRVANVSDTYGTNTQYALTSVQYESGGTVYTLGTGGNVAGSIVAINTSNVVNINDGSSGAANFTLAPLSAATSTAGKLTVGDYQLATSGLVTENSANFSDTVTVVGSHQVNAKAVTASATGVNKVYDGNTAVTNGTVALASKESGDVLNVSGIGSYSAKNVGTISYGYANVALSGADVGNYYLSGGNSFTGNNGAITAKALTASYTASNKVYDQSANATVVGSSDGIVVGDVVSFANTSATFADKHVGNGKAVTVSGISVNGTDSGNYTLQNVTASTTANITPKAITISGITAASKVYDGHASAVVDATLAAGWIGGDDVSISATGVFDNRNVGVGKTVTLTSSSSGNDARNYSITDQATTTANVTAKAVTMNLAPVSKVYDGQTAYSAGATELQALGNLLVGGDTVTTALMGFDDKNVGTGKTATLLSTTLNDGNGGRNYAVTLGANSNSTITRLNSVAWVGGVTGNWFDPANWAGGAVPDLANVTNVLIPAGTTVSFDTAGARSPAVATSAVNIDSLGNGLGNAGALSQANGILHVVGGMTLAAYAQSGGNLTIGGDLNITDGFRQSGNGNVAVQGTSRITGGNVGVQLGDFSNAGDLSISSAGGITQITGTALSVSGTSTFAAPGQTVKLDNAGNDFGGTVNLTAGNTRLKDKNTLTFSGTISGADSDLVLSAKKIHFETTTVDGNFTSNTLGAGSDGGVTQSGALTVKGKADFVANTGTGQDATLMLANNFKGGTRFTQSDGGSWRNLQVTGDSRKAAGDAQAKAQGSIPTSSLPGTGLSSELPPQALVFSSGTRNASGTETSEASSPAGANSSGVTVDLQNTSQQNTPLMVAVSLPKGVSTVGAGFSFEMPESVKGMASAGTEVRITQTDGSPLPSWLKFDRQGMRFEATAVPDSALPMQLVVVLAGQRVTVVISERTE